MIALSSAQDTITWKTIKDSFSFDRISASEFASIFHLNPSKSRRALYLQKTKQKEKSNFQSPAMMRGLNEEENALDYLKQVLGFYYVCLLRPGIIYNTELPLMASPDAISLDWKGFGIEIKTLWSKPTPNDTTQLQEYPEHVLQCIVNMACAQVQTWYLFYWEPEEPRSSRLFKVHFSLPFFDSILVPKLMEFMEIVRTKNDDQGLLKKTTKKKTSKRLFSEIELSNMDYFIDNFVELC